MARGRPIYSYCSWTPQGSQDCGRLATSVQRKVICACLSARRDLWWNPLSTCFIALAAHHTLIHSLYSSLCCQCQLPRLDRIANTSLHHITRSLGLDDIVFVNITLRLAQLAYNVCRRGLCRCSTCGISALYARWEKDNRIKFDGNKVNAHLPAEVLPLDTPCDG